MSTVTIPQANPYVGPRTFQPAERDRFFGREREARDLHSLVIAERLTLFYAQSGAGKSSLLNTRLIPSLQEAGFLVLPVARVSGDPPPGVAAIDNLFIYNVLLRLDQSEGDPARFTGMTLSRFLANLATDDGEHFYYSADEPFTVMTANGNKEEELITSVEFTTPPHVLIVDQFEEILSTHLDHWQERTGFFQQLEEAMHSDPLLWVVLVLREDYVAALDSYAPLLTGNLRARYYMERMGVTAALDAIQQPAALAGRPFAEGVAEALVDNLRRVRIAGQEEEQLGQYIEPVQLQVVCYQLWEKVIAGHPEAPQFISKTDVEQAGDVNTALADFYKQALENVLRQNDLTLSERRLRTWFDKELITEAGTRGTVYQGATETAGLPNPLVKLLIDQFLLRAEQRAGGYWIELVHDRLVDPIRTSNALWFPAHLSPLQRQAALWHEQGHTSGLLLRDAALIEAKQWAQSYAEGLEPHEEAFLAACNEAQATTLRAQRQSRYILILAIVAGVVGILACGAAGFAWEQTRNANNLRKLAEQEVARLAVEKLLQEAQVLESQNNALGAIDKLMAAAIEAPARATEINGKITDVRRQVATILVQTGEELAATGNYTAAFANFAEALALEPPPDAPIYVRIPGGVFTMGIPDSDSSPYPDQRPQHRVDIDEFWIGRTEVTNLQYKRCIDAQICTAPENKRLQLPQFANVPVSNVDLLQAKTYATWVGGRLPTEAEWEKACHGPDERYYSWGNTLPTAEYLNYQNSGLRTWTAVGSYPVGAYGLYDMAGNVWEWTSSQYRDYPYQADDGREAETTQGAVVIRGGSFDDVDFAVRCAYRQSYSANFKGDHGGFRVVIAPPRN